MCLDKVARSTTVLFIGRRRACKCSRYLSANTYLNTVAGAEGLMLFQTVGRSVDRSVGRSIGRSAGHVAD